MNNNEIAIRKDYSIRLTHEQVFNELKNGDMKLMCGDIEYSWHPGNKISIVYPNKDNELETKVIDFVWSAPYTMFHESDQYPNNLPFGPWYYGYFVD